MAIVQDDVDQELLPLFLEEANELYPQIGDALRAWREQPDDGQMERKLQRGLHTFKGSARMAGVMRLGELAHQMEERIIVAQCSPSFWEGLQNDFEQMASMIEQLQIGAGAATTATDVAGVAEDEASRSTTGRVPFSHVSRRLYRVVRQTGKELGKKVNLELQGSEVELDRGMLERITAPLEHMLRNAIDHGLERAKDRRDKGKPPVGDIRLSLRQENNELVFEFSDDGAGLDIARLRQKAVEQSLLHTDETVSDSRIMQLIFVTGLSTASKVTEVSGRGVGMDVVYSEIAALGGRIKVSSERDKGTRFVIRLPLAMAQA
jgi:chemotaxis protein histidine kinase CheA